MIPCDELVAYLDDYLAIAAVPDWPAAHNGLQVVGRKEVRCVATAVDACAATIERAVQERADMLLVHHGLFWGSTAPITGPYHRRLSLLLRNDVALYSCHTPLDAHPEVGNNHVLARMLGLRVAGLFGEAQGVPIGVWADTELDRDWLTRQVGDLLGVQPRLIPTGPQLVRRVAIITGAGASEIRQAAAAGIDTLLTGEGPHHSYFDAEECRVNAIYAGHYATETVGVKALAAHLSERFGIDTMFIDHPTGL